MKIYKAFAVAFVLLASCTLMTAQSVRPPGVTSPPVTFTSGATPPLVLDCFGYSSAQIFASAGLVATLSATTSADAVPQVFASPYSSVTAGGTTQVNTITTYPNSLYLTMGSARYVQVAISGYVSGSSTVTASCTNAVSRGPTITIPSGGIGTVTNASGVNPIQVATGSTTPVVSCPGCQYPVYNPEQTLYGCVFDGVTDVSACMQGVLNAAGTAGGGTVAMPLKPGHYSTGVSLPAGVSLYCPKVGPIDGYNGGATPPPGAACLMQIYDTVNPAIAMAANKATVFQMSFTYPNQITAASASPSASPIPYPPTIQTASGFSGANIIGNTFLNSYDAILVKAGRTIVANNNIGAFRNGISELNVHDYTNIHDNRFLPYWDAPGAFPSNIDEWVVANEQGHTFSDADAANVQGDQLFGGGKCFVFTDDGIDASYGQIIHSTCQSVTTGFYAQSSHSGPCWQIYDTPVGTLTGGHPIVFATPAATSPPQITSACVLWEGGSVWNPDNAVLDNDPNADFQIKDVPGITGTLSQVGTGQGQSNLNPVGIFPARELTSGNISTIGGCWLCFGQTNTASLAMFRFGNANGVNHFTGIAATNAHTVQGVTDTCLGINDAGTYIGASDCTNWGFLGKITAGNFNDVGVAASSNVCTDVSNNFSPCPSPTPAPTPSPTATGCGVYSGSYPYTNDTTACAKLATNTFTGTQTISNAAAIALSGTGSNAITSASTSGNALVVNATGAATNILQLQAGAAGKFTVSLGGQVTSSLGLKAGGSAVAAFPFHPAAEPTCTITSPQTTCNVTFTLPQSGMECGVSADGNPGIGTSNLLVTAFSVSGTTGTDYAAELVALTDTVTFHNACT